MAVLNAGGTAGCVLARRLAEDGSCTVLLVERGDARDNWLDRFPFGSTHHWSDRKHSMVIEADILGQKTDIIAGKGLGGTSRINGMQYTRGAPGEYNAWARSGRKGWSYNELLPYFERAECLYNPVTRSHYGTKGEQASFSRVARADCRVVQDYGRFKHPRLNSSLALLSSEHTRLYVQSFALSNFDYTVFSTRPARQASLPAKMSTTRAFRPQVLSSFTTR